MKTSIVRTVTAVVGLLTATVSQASDFTFRVPVNLQNLHQSVRTAHILCIVIGQAPGRPTSGVTIGPPRSGDTVIAESAPVEVPLRNNSYQGTITVSTTTIRGADPLDARGYRCGLILNGDRTQSGRMYEGRPGTTPVLQVGRELPR